MQATYRLGAVDEVGQLVQARVVTVVTVSRPGSPVVVGRMVEAVVEDLCDGVLGLGR